MIRKKERQSVDEFMTQFPQTDHKSKDLVNLIYNCMNDDEKIGNKGLKKEFYSKEMAEKKRLRMVQDKLIRSKAELDEIAEREDIKPKTKEEIQREKERIESEKDIEKYMYGHPTINGKVNIYVGKKFRKKKQEEEEEDTYDLRGTHSVLSNILQVQMEKDKKKMEKYGYRRHHKDEEKKKKSIFSPEHEQRFKQQAIEYQKHLELRRLEQKRKEKLLNESKNNVSNNNNNYKYPIQTKRVESYYDKKKSDNNLGELMDRIDKMDERFTQKINYNYTERPDKELMNKKEWESINIDYNNNVTNYGKNSNYSNQNNNNDIINGEESIMNYVDETNYNSSGYNTNTNYTDYTSNYNNSETAGNNMVQNLTEENPNIIQDPLEIEREVERVNKEFSESDFTNMFDYQDVDGFRPKRQYIKRKRGRPYDFSSLYTSNSNSDSTPKRKYTTYNKDTPTPRKRRRRNFFERLSRNYYSNKDSENNDMNLLEILFKEYGYNNIVYILTGSPDIKLGENKIRKIKNGLCNLLGFEKNLSRIIETIINMRKASLVDESWIKGKYNYRTRNKNNVNLTSYHYHLSMNDGFIYKFKVDKILNDGSVKFSCCEDKCLARGILYPRIRKFVIIEQHSLTALQHGYLQKGYDKYQFKMENKKWKEIQLKDNLDEKKSYIDWHRGTESVPEEETQEI